MPMQPRVLLLGWGGADWRVLQPLLDAGRLPHLQTLIDGGASGRIVSTLPAQAPARWASLATGLQADAHGLLGWVRPASDGVAATGAADWQATPLWDIAAQAGRRAAVVGWPATHPATGGAATVVSDAYAEARGATFDDWPLAAGSVWPSALAEPLRELRLHPSEVTLDQILPFCPQAARIDQRSDARLPLLVASLARAASVHGAGTWLAEHTDWDLLAVQFDLIERLSAAFMAYQAPRLPQVSQADFEIYRDVVDGAYQFMDLMLGRYLALVGRQTRVLVVSPHGFFNAHLRPPPGPAGLGDPVPPKVRPFGLLVAAGPGIRHDEPVLGASVLDVAPTVLHLLGLDAPGPMAGRVLHELLDGDARTNADANANASASASANASAHAKVIIRANGSANAHADTPRPAAAATNQPAAGAMAGGAPQPAATPWRLDPSPDPAWSAARLRELQTLGYLQPLSADPEAAAEQAAVAWLVDLAEVKTACARHHEALPLLQQALALDPGRAATQLALAECHGALGDTARSRALLDDLAAQGVRAPSLDCLRAQLCLRDGDTAGAQSHLQRAAAAGAGGRVLLERIGRVQLQARDWAAAAQSFRRALDADPDFALAHGGLGLALAGSGQHAEAAAALRRSTGLLFAQPDVHAALGTSLAAMGDAAAASQAYARALAMQPGHAEARAGLSTLHAALARHLIEGEQVRQANKRDAREAPEAREARTTRDTRDTRGAGDVSEPRNTRSPRNPRA